MQLPYAGIKTPCTTHTSNAPEGYSTVISGPTNAAFRDFAATQPFAAATVAATAQPFAAAAQPFAAATHSVAAVRRHFQEVQEEEVQ